MDCISELKSLDLNGLKNKGLIFKDFIRRSELFGRQRVLTINTHPKNSDLDQYYKSVGLWLGVRPGHWTLAVAPSGITQ